ncbi:GIY-YIG nuclease family protein [Singulisphaera sp. PoT]|uniref:GIY-YIG nuclease family protein n=1 Tax=Singulisphaera sp. PoT TaxID=3411797 RepID=UPI003BF55873
MPHVYFIRDRVARAIKIGTARDPRKRLAALQTGNPNPLKLMGTIPGGEHEEAQLHARFSAHRGLGEWFEADANFVSEVVRLIEDARKASPLSSPQKAAISTLPQSRWPGTPISDLWSEEKEIVCIGNELWHPNYGIGCVADTDGSDEQYKVSVQFSELDVIKTFVAVKSPLRLTNRGFRNATRVNWPPAWADEP